MTRDKITVLICDDSALVRLLLRKMLNSDPNIEVKGEATDPLMARQMIKDLNPDVLTLDIEMPGMDGLSFLEKIMTLRPMPVVMVSSLTQKGTAQTLKAMELGVCDVVGKPTVDLEKNFEVLRHDIITKVKTAATARVRAIGNLTRVTKTNKRTTKSPVELIAIGASTGGVVAIKEVLSHLPVNSPPVVIAQHMPEAYTANFAKRLDSITALTVLEATHHMPLHVGHVYIAPGNSHLRVAYKQGKMVTVLAGDAPVSGHRPSVDVLFESIAQAVNGPIVAALLTGMGRDGARGLLSLRRKGAHTIGQTEESCVVYGMPKVAKEIGASEIEVSLSSMAKHIENLCWRDGENK